MADEINYYILFANYTHLAELVHYAAGTVEANLQFALYERRRAMLCKHHNTCRIGKERVELVGADVATCRTATVTAKVNHLIGLGQDICRLVALLSCNVGTDTLHLLGLDKCALHTHGVIAGKEQHIAPTKQFFRAVLSKRKF